MTEEEDNDKYVVYTGIEDGAATFSLYDNGGIITQLTISPDDVPPGTDIGDHFWVDLDEADDIAELYFDPQLTTQKKKEAESAVEKYKKLKEHDKEKRSGDNGE